MKVFISVDMEGISGLVRWPDVSPTGIDFERNRQLMTQDANAAIEGAFQGGATEVVVEENHGVEDLCVLRMDTIDERCTVIRGAGRPGATTMAGLDADAGVVMLIGHHGRAGSYPGIMAHTISYTAFKLVSLAGQPIGEPDFFAIRAGELGVPVGLVSGDQIVAEQVQARCPWADTVIVKEAFGRESGEVIPPVRARPMIEEAAARTVRRALAGEYQPLDVRGPYEFEVQLRQPAGDAMRANLDGLEGFDLAEDTRVVVTAPDMDLGFRRVAYLGYANQPGVTKH
ncbi:MAG: aminopeptidase [Gammaproteobacteria bacterium]|nr:aminopeptidase [Gammaproteobacteria bacterium]|tara:strand:+ start:3321 stop:4175 length:855 start_codon:yes stop_codon:yes gene_type:complete